MSTACILGSKKSNNSQYELLKNDIAYTVSVKVRLPNEIKAQLK